MAIQPLSIDAQSPNPFAAHQHLLHERLDLFLALLHPALRADVEQALAEKGKLLSQSEEQSPPRPAGMWPLLTMLVAQHIQPEISLTLISPVAIAVECYVCALDLLDDVEDDDQTAIVRSLGMARTLNVSTTLLAMSLQAILSLHESHTSPALIARLLEAMRTSMLDAVNGQHRDLVAERRNARELTREECIEIAAGKAGAIMSLACHLGAICAGAKKRQREQFAQMGTLLGIAHQLDNDAHDLYYLLQREILHDSVTEVFPVSVKSDLRRGKKTLPVVLAELSLMEKFSADNSKLDRALQNLSELSDREKEEYQGALHEGIISTWGLCLLYRERAHACLQEIEARKSISAELRLLLGFETS